MGELVIDSEQEPGVLRGFHHDRRAERIERLHLDELGVLHHAVGRHLSLDALLHLVGGVACERQHEDVPRPDIFPGYEVQVPPDDGVRLPRAGSGVDDHHAVQGLGYASLRLVELTHRHHPPRRRRHRGVSPGCTPGSMDICGISRRRWGLPAGMSPSA